MTDLPYQENNYSERNRSLTHIEFESPHIDSPMPNQDRSLENTN